MGRRRYPSLTPAEVIGILEALGFAPKRQTGSHRHFERPASATSARRLVTVDMSIAAFWPEIMQSMVKQSGASRTEFYGATVKTRKKI